MAHFFENLKKCVNAIAPLNGKLTLNAMNAKLTLKAMNAILTLNAMNANLSLNAMNTNLSLNAVNHEVIPINTKVISGKVYPASTQR